MASFSMATIPDCYIQLHVQEKNADLLSSYDIWTKWVLMDSVHKNAS